MYDLIYFGYPDEDNAIRYENEFIDEIKEEYPEVELENAYDQIKGHRQQVKLDDSKEEEYLIWIIAQGWSHFSLTMNIMNMDPNERPKLKSLIQKAKELYPEKFKKDQ